MKTKVAQSLQQQKLNYDKLTKDSTFDVNEKVFVNNPQGTPTWLEGIVTEITGPLSYKINLSYGSIIRHHIDHIHIHYSPPWQDIPTKTDIDDSFILPQHQPTGFLVVSWCCTDEPNMTSNITEILKY